MAGCQMTRMNTLRNGSRISRLSLGALPTQMHRVQRFVRGYRVEIENLVAETKGEVDATDAHYIDAATQHMQHMAICRWVLRTKFEGMSALDIQKCSGAIAAASEARNRSIALLKLDASAVDTLTALYVDSTPVEPPEATIEPPEAENAAESASEDSSPMPDPEWSLPLWHVRPCQAR